MQKRNQLSISIFIGVLFFIISCSDSTEEPQIINPENETGTLLDIEGNVYRTVKIGDQWWMAENLKTTKFSDGENIPLVTPDYDWFLMKSEAYCWYDNDSTLNASKYGALYNWYAVETEKLCPTGWHVPTHEDWGILKTHVGFFSATKLKELSKDLWKEGDTSDNAISLPESNATGFSALPGGLRIGSYGEFQGLGRHGAWWSSSLLRDGTARTFRLSYNGGDATRQSSYVNLGHSCRCIRD